MFISDMGSKRQRRPNVRLAEIGDVSAAHACGFSQRSKENLVQKKWRHDYLYSCETYENFKQNSPEFAKSDPTASPRLKTDMHRNGENRNPNSVKSSFEKGSSEEIDISKSILNFGDITRKRRGSRGNNNVFTVAYAFEHSPENEISNEDGEEVGRKEIVGFVSSVGDSLYPYNGFKDYLEGEISPMSRKAFEDGVAKQSYDMWKEEDCQEANNMFQDSRGGGDQIGYGGSTVISVRGWLDELGFGKYAALFEMHQVDKETLPYLTLGDLKEMGLLAVGARRKLYSAIERLRERQDGSA